MLSFFNMWQDGLELTMVEYFGSHKNLFPVQTNPTTCIFRVKIRKQP